MRYGIKLIAFKGDTVDIWVKEGRRRVELESLEEAQEAIKGLLARSPQAKYRPSALTDFYGSGVQPTKDVVAPKGYRFKDGSHTRPVHSDAEASLVCNEEMEPCPPWCSCQKKETLSFRNRSVSVEYQRSYGQ